MPRVYLTPAEKKEALSDPQVRTRVLENVRSKLREHRAFIGLSRSELEELEAQLQCPPMFLYESGLFEIVAPSIDPGGPPGFDWLDLSVELVPEQGSSDLNAGDVIWSCAGA